MPSCLRSIVLPCFIATISLILSSSLSHAVEVWSGLTYTFSKPSGADGTLPQYQDAISNTVTLARNDFRGLYNANSESGFTNLVSPEFTGWATLLTSPGETITATNWANLTFTAWETAFGAGGRLLENILSYDAVLRIDFEDIYLDLRLTQWGSRGDGAFAYQRSQPPMPEPSGDYNTNGIVDAADYTYWRDTLGQMVSAGTFADGSGNGLIDLPDYNHWKARFGNIVPPGAGGGQFSTVPEPSGILISLAAMLMFAVFRRFS